MGDYLLIAAVMAMFWIGHSLSKLVPIVQAFHSDYRRAIGLKPGENSGD